MNHLAVHDEIVFRYFQRNIFRNVFRLFQFNPRATVRYVNDDTLGPLFTLNYESML